MTRDNKETARRKLDQLESLLLLMSGSNFQAFDLLSEHSQQAALDLAYDLSVAARKAAH